MNPRIDVLLIGDLHGEWMDRTTSILTQYGVLTLNAPCCAAAADTFAGVDVVVVHVVAGQDPLVEVAALWEVRAQVPVIFLGDDIDDALCAAAIEAGVAHVTRACPTPEELIAMLRMASEQSRAGTPELVRAMCRTMCTLSSLVASAKDSSFLQASVLQISSLFQAPIVSVMLFDDDDDDDGGGARDDAGDDGGDGYASHSTHHGAEPQLRVVAQVGLGAQGFGKWQQRPRRDGVAERVARARMPRIILRSAKRDDTFDGVALRNEITASMCVPIPAASSVVGVGNGRPRGVINVAKTRAWSVFTPRDLDICVSIAGLIGDALMMIETREMQATMQQRLSAVERLSTVGEIAGGIAHEVANPIACVRANVDVMIEYMRDLAPALAEVEDSHPELHPILDDFPSVLCETWEGLARAEDVVRQMKALVRLNGPTGRDERVTLSTLVEDTMRLLRPRMKVPVQLELQNDVVVRGSPVELSQVLVNLVVNAGDACEGREGAKVRVAVAVDGNNAAIHIVDNGTGIAPETMKRIFLPLFTTKPGDRGTGLGLSIVRRVVEEHGGTVRVHSTLGSGTAFVVTLPLMDGAHSRVPMAVDASDSPIV